jgi:nucleotide-binding universal stress UspA family protein
MAQPPHGSGTLVLGIDFSPASERALDHAIRTAREMGAHLILVHALRPLGAPGLDLQHPAFDPERNESSDALPQGAQPQAWLQRARQAGVGADIVTRAGDPVHVILEEAHRRRAQAIVVGSHGRTGLGKRLLGSVAEGVLRRSDVPVMVVPGAAGAA